MSLSTLDPKTALIVIDLQKGVVPLPLVHPLTEVVSNARARSQTHSAVAVFWSCSSMSPAYRRGEREQARGTMSLCIGFATGTNVWPYGCDFEPGAVLGNRSPAERDQCGKCGSEPGW
jgi:nicotinamidase-related amidase